ncbi:helix-turn-helix transcriptional regulator [Streptomyces sp. NPDC056007]|uniref:helix-turn-helix transcriptional regulator n=1 Tax=Streptomyces sp. NPDC056007 TaxID=3345678 RepID=UPI0035D6441A
MSAAHNISRNLRHFRRARGWTQAEVSRRFAEITGEAPRSVAAWSAAERSPESGRTRSWTANDVAALAVLFDVPIADLFEERPVCRGCEGEPPAGFTCNACGATGAVAESVAKLRAMLAPSETGGAL